MSTVYVVVRKDIDHELGQQIAHVISDLCVTFMGGSETPPSFRDWATHHKTVVIKKARDLEDLYQIYLKMHREAGCHTEGFFDTTRDTELTVFATEPVTRCPTILELLPEL